MALLSSAWLALQIPLGALIGMLLQRGMAQPRRRVEARTVLMRLMQRRLALTVVLTSGQIGRPSRLLAEPGVLVRKERSLPALAR